MDPAWCVPLNPTPEGAHQEHSPGVGAGVQELPLHPCCLQALYVPHWTWGDARTHVLLVWGHGLAEEQGDVVH